MAHSLHNGLCKCLHGLCDPDQDCALLPERQGDKEEMKKVQRERREKITEGGECYRRKLERKLQQKNLREVWSGMRTITGHGAKTITYQPRIGVEGVRVAMAHGIKQTA